MIFVKAMKCIALSITSIPLGGCAIAVGLIFSSLIEAESYAPELGGMLFTRAILGFGLVESFSLFIMAIAGIVFIL